MSNNVILQNVKIVIEFDFTKCYIKKRAYERGQAIWQTLDMCE